eukprot:Gb_37835 [translate_table: standard]
MATLSVLMRRYITLSFGEFPESWRLPTFLTPVNQNVKYVAPEPTPALADCRNLGYSECTFGHLLLLNIVQCSFESTFSLCEFFKDVLEGISTWEVATMNVNGDLYRGKAWLEFLGFLYSLQGRRPSIEGTGKSLFVNTPSGKLCIVEEQDPFKAKETKQQQKSKREQ